MTCCGWSRVLFPLRHPWWSLFTVALVAVIAFAGVQGWAWYQLDLGIDAMNRYRHEEAYEHFRSCLRIWPGSLPAQLGTARVARRLGRLDEAARYIDECRKQADSEVSADVAFEWALLRAANGDLRGVEPSLQARALSRPADAPLIWEALSQGYRRMCRMPEALVCLDKWLIVEPGNAYAYFMRGEIHRHVGAVNRARDEYRKVVELDSSHDEARRQLVRCLAKVGRYQEAVEHLQILLQKAPKDPEFRTLLARAQYDLGQIDEAVALLDLVLQEHPAHGPALRERGRFAVLAEDFAAAEAYFRRALEVLPYNYEVNWGLYQALQGLQRTSDAKDQLAIAQEIKDRNERISDIQMRQMHLHPFDAALHSELGSLLLAGGQRDSAKLWFLSALQLDPRLSAAHDALARLYEAEGDTAAAARHRLEAAHSPPSERK